MLPRSLQPCLVRGATALLAAALSATLLAQSTFAPLCFGTASACPCGNAPPQPDTGCLNSFGQGGRLSGSGNAQIVNDTVLLTASGLPTTTTIIFFQGDERVNDGAGAPFGDGLRCIQGAMTWRLGVRQALGGQIAFGYGITGDPVISIRGGLNPRGGTIRYQGWYRNAAAFCTPDGFNTTNAVEVDWIP